MSKITGQMLMLQAPESGLQWLLYGQWTVPFWLVSLLVGAAVTAGLLYFVRG